MRKHLERAPARDHDWWVVTAEEDEESSDELVSELSELLDDVSELDEVSESDDVSELVEVPDVSELSVAVDEPLVLASVCVFDVASPGSFPEASWM
jgi:hypothetical protein